MGSPEPREGAGDASIRPEEYSARLREIQGREWWTWGFSLLVMLLLTAAVASLAIPAIQDEKNAVFGSGVFQAIAGLVCLILLFCGYLTYEKFLINRLRLELAERQIQWSRWRELALVDPLTGLYNRRFAERRLKAEIARAQRKGYPLTVVLFDLDEFKTINDRYGHSAGDLVLKEFGNRLSRAVREADVAARLGGDEFMLLLIECDSSHLAAVLRRLESIVADVDGQRVPVSYSVGFKEYRPGEQPQDVLDAADKALYLDKQSRKGLIPAAVKS